MPASLDATLHNGTINSYEVLIPLPRGRKPGQTLLEIRMWLVQHGLGLYNNRMERDAMLKGKESWVFTDHATAIHFKLLFS